ncbi:MAG: sodium:proton antiporter [Pirellulales bacterium]|nr:sodium:proton antiporter [Pirellulales bacterium]
MSHSHPSDVHGSPASAASSSLPVILGIAIALVIYGGALLFQWPQTATEMINGRHHAVADEHVDDHAADAHGDETHPTADGHAKHEIVPPTFFMVLPFALLLGAIAVFPLVPAIEHWWESNLHRFYVAAGLGLLTLVYYLVAHGTAVERHFLGHAVIEPGAGWLSFGLPWTVFQNAIFNEYIPFIILLFALYTISGGIRIEGDLVARPATNTAFIAIGGVLASFIGTTGAAMLLIRPLLETNSQRKQVAHTAVFFIFVVCNCGGCLLPIGDPPLFLGYLQGVDFLWTLQLFPQWLFVNGCLILVYYLWDRFYAYPREEKRELVRDESQVRRLQFSGVAINAPLLLGVVAAVAMLDPSKTLPGTQWHPWLYLREMLLLLFVLISLVLGSSEVRRKNNFNYGAIIEVAALFLGIFLCMQPALQILDVRGAELGIDTPQKFFWATGTLSSVLDNAPTYLVFFKTAQSLDPGSTATMAGVAVDLLVAISLGAVFMGAMTYIGNGPNFMVKAIAEKAGVRMPGFFGYMVYSVSILLPILVLMTLLFL